MADLIENNFIKQVSIDGFPVLPFLFECRKQFDLQTMNNKSHQDLVQWMGVLETYARDWDSTFEHRPAYFTQEFWYLLVSCLKANWVGTPLTVSAACQSMKSGSNRTREERIKKAVVDGFLIKKKGSADGREAIVVPTEKLEALMKEHFARTLKYAQKQLKKIKN